MNARRAVAAWVLGAIVVAAAGCRADVREVAWDVGVTWSPAGGDPIAAAERVRVEVLAWPDERTVQTLTLPASDNLSGLTSALRPPDNFALRMATLGGDGAVRAWGRTAWQGAGGPIGRVRVYLAPERAMMRAAAVMEMPRAFATALVSESGSAILVGGVTRRTAGAADSSGADGVGFVDPSAWTTGRVKTADGKAEWRGRDGVGAAGLIVGTRLWLYGGLNPDAAPPRLSADLRFYDARTTTADPTLVNFSNLGRPVRDAIVLPADRPGLWWFAGGTDADGVQRREGVLMSATGAADARTQILPVGAAAAAGYALFRDGRLRLNVVVGGRCGNDAEVTGCLLTPAGGSFDDLRGTLALPREPAHAASGGDVYLFGGVGADAAPVTAVYRVYDACTAPAAPCPKAERSTVDTAVARTGHTAAGTAGEMLVCGGRDAAGVPVDVCERFVRNDDGTLRADGTLTMSGARDGGRIVRLDTGVLVVMGGFDATGGVVPTIDVYTPAYPGPR